MYVKAQYYNTFTTYYYGPDNKQYKIKIREPNDSNSKYPVYVYTTGTTMCENGQYGSYAYKIDNHYIKHF